MSDDFIVTTPTDVCAVLLGRAYQELAECGAEPIDTVYVAAGMIAWDSCCGLLVAAPERTYRSAQFPIEGTTDYVCESSVIVVDVVILLLRCVPTIDDRGKPPPVGALQTAYSSILADAAIIWNAVTSEMPEGWQRANVNQGYVGAQGGCVGVETRLSIGLPQDRWCPPCTPPYEPVLTGVVAGSPGSFEPAGAPIPFNLNDLGADPDVGWNGPNKPGAAWATNEYVNTGDGFAGRWTGDSWIDYESGDLTVVLTPGPSASTYIDASVTPAEPVTFGVPWPDQSYHYFPAPTGAVQIDLTDNFFQTIRVLAKSDDGTKYGAMTTGW